MARSWPILLPLSLLMAFGIAEGIWTERWHQSHAAEEAGARLSSIPPAVGDWESREEQLDPRQVVKAELTGSLVRHYTNRSTGVTVTVMLVCGRPGPISVHTPDVCFVDS